MRGPDCIATQVKGFLGQQSKICDDSWSGEIIRVTFRKFATSLVQQLKKIFISPQKLSSKVLTATQFIYMFSKFSDQ